MVVLTSELIPIVYELPHAIRRISTVPAALDRADSSLLPDRRPGSAFRGSSPPPIPLDEHLGLRDDQLSGAL
jgi:hypothetical protein